MQLTTIAEHTVLTGHEYSLRAWDADVLVESFIDGEWLEVGTLLVSDEGATAIFHSPKIRFTPAAPTTFTYVLVERGV